MKRLPLYDETAPIACTLSPDDIPARVALLDRLRLAVVGLARVEHGLLLTFEDREDVAAELRRFVVDEQRCCTFWGFELGVDGPRPTLRWEAPPTAAPLIAGLEAFFRGGDLSLDLAGLL